MHSSVVQMPIWVLEIDDARLVARDGLRDGRNVSLINKLGPWCQDRRALETLSQPMKYGRQFEVTRSLTTSSTLTIMGRTLTLLQCPTCVSQGYIAMQPLIIELSSIPHEGVSQCFTSTGSALGIVDAELTVVRPVKIECQFFKVNREVVVQGTLRSAARLACSRCAEEFEQPLSIALDAVYLPMHEIASERAKEIEQGVADVYAHADEMIDIAEMVRDKLLLSIPLQSHCMVGCKGLCPSCGVNRNVVSCQCAEEKLGSPFELLKGLRLS